nr:DNA polymerase III subunit delta' [Anaerobacterium chartisolvens]
MFGLSFNNITGQREVIDGLAFSIKNDRVAHAYVFTGPKGIGKRTVAKLFAGMLLCTCRTDMASCANCPSCSTYMEGSNPDFFVIERENSAIGIEEIRGIQSSILVKPLYSEKKVYVIADAENMTVQAQNCLLKILEEPPPYAVIILTASNYKALMETIRSRTLRYNFRKNTPQEVRTVLADRLGENNPRLDFLAAYADGVIGAALQIADSEEFASLRDSAVDVFMRLSAKASLSGVFREYDFFESNKESANVIFDAMLLFCRDLLVYKNTGKENMLINSDKRDIILNSAHKFTSQKLVNSIEEIEKARRSIAQNASFQLSVEVMLMKLQEEYS